MKQGKQSISFNDVYIDKAASCIGPLEGEGPLKPYVDKIYDNMHLEKKSFEASEREMQRDLILLLKQKALFLDTEIDVLFSGDLINQSTVSSYTMREFDIPYVNLYGACSTFALATIHAGVFIDSKNAKKAIALTTSHTLAAERTLRYPVEYGGAKDAETTYTVMGGGAFLLSNKKSKIKLTKATIGKVIDFDYSESTNLGIAMAPAAIEVLTAHFEDFCCDSSEYDLILTGDLSKLGRAYVFNALSGKYGDMKNYDDCGLLAYDIHKQKVFSGGSGCGCCASVVASYIYRKMLDGDFSKVLVVGTGALMNQTTNLQKEAICSIAHAFVLEVVDK